MANLGDFANANPSKRRTSFGGTEIIYGDFLSGTEWFGTFADIRVYFAPDAATTGAAGLMSAADKGKLDGLSTDVVEEAPIDGSEYNRKNGAWSVPSASGISDAPNNGSMYVRASLGWTILPAAGISDAPDDAQEYTRKSLGWVVAASADTSRVLKGTTITSAGSPHTFVTADIGKKFECDTTGGIVEIVFDDQATVASGYQALAFFKRIGTHGGNALKFTAGATASGGTVTLATTPVAAGASTNASTDLSTNTKKTFTIPAGTNVALGIAYYGIANASLVDALSPGFKLNVGSGSDPTTHFDWGTSASDLNAGRVRCWSRILPLGTLGSDTIYDWLPEWGGATSNITSYTVIFFWAYGVNQTTPAEAVQAIQYASATSESISYSNIPSGDLNRKIVYTFCRRSNALVGVSASTISLSGAAGDIQGANGNNNVQSNRYNVGHENGVDGSANLADFSWDNSLSVPSASITWAFNPSPGTMGMTIKGTAGNVASTTTTNANHTVPILYDQNALTVEVQL